MTNAEAIHKHVGERSGERAASLWRLYQSYGRKDEVLAGKYLDIGAGNLENAALFSRELRIKDAVGVDIRKSIVKKREIMTIRADALNLPFRSQSFHVVSMFSLVEHVSDHRRCLSEAMRVRKQNGDLVIQFPNRYFPIELHSGLPLLFYLPRRVRNWFARICGYDRMREIDIPSVGKVITHLLQLEPQCQLRRTGFFYRETLIPSSILRRVHRILRWAGIFRILPMGYFLVVSSGDPHLDKLSVQEIPNQ